MNQSFAFTCKKRIMPCSFQILQNKIEKKAYVS